MNTERVTFRASPVDFANLATLQRALPNGRGGSLLNLSEGLRVALQVAARAADRGQLQDLLAASAVR